jgi:hypothetical protein
VGVNGWLKVGAVRAAFTRMHVRIIVFGGFVGLVFFGHGSLLFTKSQTLE